jgi:hypothetical protein
MKKKREPNVIKQGGKGVGIAANTKAEAGADAAIEAAEHLTRDLARVRANFGMDPALAPRSLAAAWISPTDVTEEGEAEFVDAVADCLGAGLSLGAALDCWDNGDLFYDVADDSAVVDEDAGAMVVPITSAKHASGRRLFVR